MGTKAISSFSLSDRGIVRGNNEDLNYHNGQRGIFIVIDGMGGQAAGERAAEIALDKLKLRLLNPTADSVEERIGLAITIANNAIYQEAKNKEELRGMACVLTVAVVEGKDVVYGHVGDSRMYKLHRGQITKITKDHSPVGEREDSGDLTEEEAMQHPRRNEVYRDVGSQERTPDDEDFFDLGRVPFDPDSAFLLCSDGLSDLVPSGEIKQIIEQSAGAPEEVVSRLIQAANDAGGKDNVTAVYFEGDRYAASLRGELIPVMQVAPASADAPTRRDSRVPVPQIAAPGRGALLPAPSAIQQPPPSQQTFEQNNCAAQSPESHNRMAQIPPPPPDHVPEYLKDDYHPPGYGKPRPQPPVLPVYHPGDDTKDMAGPVTPGYWLPDAAGSSHRSKLKPLLIGATVMLISVCLLIYFFPALASSAIGLFTGQNSTNVIFVSRSEKADYQTIMEALNNAKSGDTIKVGFGTYLEKIVLKEGVRVIADKRFSVTIEPPAPESPAPSQDNDPESDDKSKQPNASDANANHIAVIANDLSEGSLEGFLIRGGNGRPLSIGVQVTNANVKLINLTISEATAAAVEITGNSTAELRDSTITNSAVGVKVSGNASPRIVRNHFSDNGKDIDQPPMNSRVVEENNQFSKKDNQDPRTPVERKVGRTLR